MTNCYFCGKEIKQSYFILYPNMPMCDNCHRNNSTILGKDIGYMKK